MTNDSGFLTSHQSLSNYSTLANTVKSLSISGKTITVTPGSGDAYTLTTQDTTYTHPTSSGNKHIPSGGSSGQFLGWSADGTAKWVNNPNSDTKNTAGSTDTSSKIFLIGATSQAANPQTYSHDTAYVGTDGCLYSGGTKVLTAHQSLSNYSTLANTIKSLSISGKTITYTKGDNTTGTLTTQDNNTWTAMVGATSSSNGSVGYVNAVPPKDGYNTKYLRADGTWQVPPDHTYTVNNATLTIQKNGTTVKTFTANASSNVTCNITVPTKTSELTNNSGFLTSHQSLSSRVPVAGGAVMTGVEIGRTVDNSYLCINGGTTSAGGSICAYGKNYDYPGSCLLHTDNGTKDTNYFFHADGSVTFGSDFRFNTDVTFQIGNAGGMYSLFRYDGVIWNNSDRFIPLNNMIMNLGGGGNAWKDCWLQNSPTVVSDIRQKTQIQNIDDDLLNAWENVSPKTFKMVSAVEKKGEQARFHTGYIAQDIEKACTDNNIDATRYGLFCFDSWDEQPEVTEDVEVEKDGVKTTESRIVQEKRAKGDSYSLRYEEALVVECAYLRRENKRLNDRLAVLEELFKQYIAK